MPSLQIPQEEQKWQLETLAVLWDLAATNPESSIKRIQLHDVHDFTSLGDIWYAAQMPGFRVLRADECPEGVVGVGMSYETVVMDPGILLTWLRRRLEASGVVFKRVELAALEDAREVVDCDVLVNATGAGPLLLEDVRDAEVKRVRGQTLLVRNSCDRAFIRQGRDYTYAIPRLDGSVIIGGIRQEGVADTEVDMELARDVSAAGLWTGLNGSFTDSAITDCAPCER